MRKIIFLAAGLFISVSLHATSAEPQNCVNPGGGCDGTVPCCNASVNACVRGRCTPVPKFAPILLNMTGASEVLCYDACTDSLQAYPGNGCARSYNKDLQCDESTGIYY